MINIKHRRGQKTARVTFSLDDDRRCSVIGDFNEWDPHRSPLVKRSNGLRSAAVEVPVGTEIRFRYLADDGEFFDDQDADVLEPNGFGSTHGVVLVG